LRSGSDTRRIVLLLLIMTGCVIPSAPEPLELISVSDGWLAMGTFFEADLRVRPDERERARAWLEWARREIARLETIYSRHDPASALSSLNRALANGDGIRNAVRLDPELESALFSAVEVWEETGGAFDMTIGPVVNVWAEAAAQGKLPGVESLRRATRQVGTQGLLLLGRGGLRVTISDMRIDLDGISKGVVLDRLRERLEADLPDAAVLLSFGESSILAIGDPDGEGWKLVLRSRNPSNRNLGTLRLRDRALSVSSSIGSVVEIEGQRVSHIIDPRTGSAIEESVEVVVIADRAAIADGWSTALGVVGANRAALRMAEKAGIEANILDGSGRNVITKGWDISVSGKVPRSIRK
jgi:thiamine biosynthesis lipoprotein